MKKSEILWLLGILLLGGFLRFYLIGSWPCGLFPDQAINGLDALNFAGGTFSPVFNGKEGLFIYFVALSHFVFGTGIWQIFIVSALLGTATILSSYLAVREFFNKRIAFFSSFFLAVSGWHIAVSRSGFRAILVPLVISLFFYFLGRSLKSKKKINYYLLAAIFGLGFYTYNAYLVFGLAVMGIAAIWFWQRKKKMARAEKQALAIFGTIILPILLFMIIFPEKYFARAGEVSILASSENILAAVKLFFSNFGETLTGIFFRGDFNWRHNPAGSPLLNLFLFPFFIGGVFLAIWKRKKEYLAALFLTVLMLLPAVLTNEGEPPHGLRVIGILPVLFVFPAIALDFILERKRKEWRFITYLLIFFLLLATGYKGFQNYFFPSTKEARHFYEDFRCDISKAVDYIKGHDQVVVIADGFSFQSVRYLLYPNEVEHYTPVEFKDMVREKDFTEKKFVVISDFEKFDKEILEILQRDYGENSFVMFK